MQLLLTELEYGINKRLQFSFGRSSASIYLQKIYLHNLSIRLIMDKSPICELTCFESKLE